MKELIDFSGHPLVPGCLVASVIGDPQSRSQPVLVLGIMSGTSLDGVDYALCEIASDRVRLLSHWQAPFPARLRERLHATARGEALSYEVGQLHHDLGRFYARHAVKRSQRSPQLVGLHGQTIYHHPDSKAPATLQIGEPAYLVAALNVSVVTNFRAQDIAAGGQGAPLATLFHKVTFARRGEHICVHNLGGISNVTSIDWRHGRSARLLAFDTGPGNVLIDLAARHFSDGRSNFDTDGRWGARGLVADAVLRRWLNHPYFHRPPPKSTGRQLFGETFFERAIRALPGISKYDVIATLTEFTARSLALNYRLYLPSLPDEVILTGGGSANAHLVGRIQQQLGSWSARTKVVTSRELGWPPQSVEPAAFALLAYYRWARKPANIPSTTGARRRVLLGQVAEL